MLQKSRKRCHSESKNCKKSEQEIKRKRRYSENSEEKLNEEGQQNALVYREIDSYISKYKKYNTFNHVTKFVIRSFSGDPEGDLKKVILVLNKCLFTITDFWKIN